MRKEACPHCLSSVYVNVYTRAELRKRVLEKLTKHPNLPPSLLVEVLVCEGYRADDLRKELSRLSDDKIVDIDERRVWIIDENVE